MADGAIISLFTSFSKKMKHTNATVWILRIGVAGEFIGHGLLAVGGKQDWIGWIRTLINVDQKTATAILLVVGILDVLLALLVLIRPIRPVILWMAIWGFFTALLRPIVGIGWLDFIERFANWAAPLALYFLLLDTERGN